MITTNHGTSAIGLVARMVLLHTCHATHLVLQLHATAALEPAALPGQSSHWKLSQSMPPGAPEVLWSERTANSRVPRRNAGTVLLPAAAGHSASTDKQQTPNTAMGC